MPHGRRAGKDDRVVATGHCWDLSLALERGPDVVALRVAPVEGDIGRIGVRADRLDCLISYRACIIKERDPAREAAQRVLVLVALAKEQVIHGADNALVEKSSDDEQQERDPDLDERVLRLIAAREDALREVFAQEEKRNEQSADCRVHGRAVQHERNVKEPLAENHVDEANRRDDERREQRPRIRKRHASYDGDLIGRTRTTPPLIR